jgi:hypothetical protein
VNDKGHYQHNLGSGCPDNADFSHGLKVSIVGTDAIFNLASSNCNPTNQNRFVSENRLAQFLLLAVLNEMCESLKSSISQS